ncbi:MAG: hypothetical protein JKX99_02860 [Robiginitomaculum sp.]|nr:hypothetical protein [Robiginitomaculum sp.]
MLGPASLNGIMAGWQFGLPVYGSLSVYRGSKPWTGDPVTQIANHTARHVGIQISADNANQASVVVARIFAETFTKALSTQIDRTWKQGKTRFYDIDLLMLPPDTQISRKYTRIFFGKTFHTQFYLPFRAAGTDKYVGKMYRHAGILAHEFYHLRSSQLGGANAKPFRKDLTRTQRHILEEAGGKLFGSCVELQVKELITLGSSVIHSKLDKATGEVRYASLSDKMIRDALTPGITIHRDDLTSLGSMLFASFWLEQTKGGINPLIHRGDAAAIKMQQVCDTNLAHPTDLWPIFWEMANDGIDAPELERVTPKPAT